MFALHQDASLNFEILRNLAVARYGGSDVNELLQVAGRVDSKNLETFYDAFVSLAERVDSQGQAIDSARHPVSARDAFFRAATYYRAADFYLHGNPSDPRINTLWEKQQVAFDKALALMDIPGQRVTLKADGFEVPAIYYAASKDSSVPRPTVIAGSGYDGGQEELLHNVGFAALERGYNFITYEGPGQPLVRRNQNLGFIAEWEKVVTPVVDYLSTRSDVDSSKIALIGISMAGYLAVRAAAFEHRLACVMAIDGVYSVYEAYRNAMTGPMRDVLDSGDREKLDEMVRQTLKADIPIVLRWGIEQGLWSFNTDSASVWMDGTRKMTLDGLTDKIQCPVWVGEAEVDQFFLGQPEKVRDALGDRATYVALTSSDSAENHCHVGAQVLVNQLIFDWFDDVIDSK
ncbi:Alpha/Beta hydrolase protein [Thelonectria olida]|uniref:Alpha/Beta hydrolase protein n=1 Tax=Thelonectria olida TaxID=1576542 RepID=A0A9P9AMD4_9HYPO|nr:Alpha/Beta hydrolase protein [Thelonectria olida]